MRCDESVLFLTESLSEIGSGCLLNFKVERASPSVVSEADLYSCTPVCPPREMDNASKRRSGGRPSIMDYKMVQPTRFTNVLACCEDFT